MNAYELAKQLEERHAPYEDDAANMLRQQADELNKVVQKLVKANGLIENLRIRIAELESLYWQQVYKNIPAQTKPLSDEEINQLSGYHIEIEWFDEGEYGMEYNIYGVKDLVRAIEERHGIK